MGRHSASEAAKEAAVRRQKGTLFVPPPEEWDYGQRGRPTWIGSGGEWAVVVDRTRIEYVELPQGWPEETEARARLGRPPLEERDPKKLLHAAWLKDCGGDTYVEVARQLRFRLSGIAGEYDAKKNAIRYVKRGRAFASALGIWPWASWPQGTPPKPSWWLDDRCRDWLLLWRLEGRRDAVNRSAIQTQLLLRSALERSHLLAGEIHERLRSKLFDSIR